MGFISETELSPWSSSNHLGPWAYQIHTRSSSLSLLFLLSWLNCVWWYHCFHFYRFDCIFLQLSVEYYPYIWLYQYIYLLLLFDYRLHISKNAEAQNYFWVILRLNLMHSLLEGTGLSSRLKHWRFYDTNAVLNLQAWINIESSRSL